MFNRKKTAPLSAAQIEFPSGLCVKTEAGHWYINGKFRNRLGSKRVFQSWNFPRVVESTESSLAKYTKGKKLGFRDGTLVRQMSTGSFYFISQRKRRLVANPDVLTLMGFKPSDAVWVADFEINLHEEGEKLN